MKTTQLKQLIKESVKEAISEELRDILLEVVKSKTSNTITETKHETNHTSFNDKPSLTESQKREKYQEIINSMSRGQDTLSFNSSQAQNLGGNFSPQGPVDSVNGKLPDGEVSMSQITQFLK